MKFFKYLLIAPLLIGCNSKNNSIEVLKNNASEYSKVSKTYAYRSNSAIVFMQFNGDSINFKLIEKNQDDDIELMECIIDKTTYIPSKLSSDINKKYIINLNSFKKNIKLSCKLSNNEKIVMKMKKY